nr:MAG TPA: hypothetical protein [Bacteriophage sp.]
MSLTLIWDNVNPQHFLVENQQKSLVYGLLET